mgnify:FL=1|jgi:hypothetical protein
MLMVERYEQLLGTIDMFAMLPQENRVLLLKDSSEIVLGKKERLYEPGSFVRGIYIVLEGVLRETM